ncbi:hypothetical protein [Verrucomicrobium spinosum]|uniref:hypothetical protein n=1 Tax=Verrucomicrobium spinosum TaxID=2736 RepID=UPI0001746600|nr:hypothetical protein [Verrucomicrobium spinosum]
MYRIPIIKIVVCLVFLAASLMATAGEFAEARGAIDDIEITVKYRPSYPSSKSVVLDYVIANNSTAVIKRFQANETLDLIVNLLDPSGNPIIAYKDEPGVIEPEVYKRLYVQDMLPGTQSTGTIDLATHYPLKSTGIYKCTLTRVLYKQNATIKWEGGTSPPGDRFEIPTPQFSFDLESIDPDFRSPFSSLLKMKDGVITKDGVPVKGVNVNPTPPPTNPHSPPGLNEAEERLRAADTPARPPYWIIFLLVAGIAGAVWVLTKKRN